MRTDPLYKDPQCKEYEPLHCIICGQPIYTTLFVNLEFCDECLNERYKQEEDDDS